MERVGVYDARSRLSRLIEQAEAGEEVVITRHGKPVVKLVPARSVGEVDNSAAVDALIEFSKTIKPRKRISWRELIAAGRR